MNLRIEMNLDNDAFQRHTRSIVEACIDEALGKADWRNVGAVDGVVTDPIPIIDPNGNKVGKLLLSP